MKILIKSLVTGMILAIVFAVAPATSFVLASLIGTLVYIRSN